MQKELQTGGQVPENRLYLAHFLLLLTAKYPELIRTTMKTNKSYTKRIKVTKNGKLVARKPGQNHFNARQTGQQRLRRKKTQLLSLSKRITRRFLPKSGA